ncbi:hypothetical protein [Marinomonas sp.]|uniref:hypothetical protein n=1 Tax=Marinomonas sp. TaxID=1904862 RepID=UPI003BA9F7C6
MSEENKTKSTETSSGPNKNVTPPKIVYVTDSWDGAPRKPDSGKSHLNESSKGEK